MRESDIDARFLIREIDWTCKDKTHTGKDICGFAFIVTWRTIPNVPPPPPLRAKKRSVFEHALAFMRAPSGETTSNSSWISCKYNHVFDTVVLTTRSTASPYTFANALFYQHISRLNAVDDGIAYLCPPPWSTVLMISQDTNWKGTITWT